VKKAYIVFILFIMIMSCSSTEKTASRIVTKVYISADGNSILLDTPDTQGEVLFEERGSVFQIIETTGDNQWIIVIQMAAEASGERDETVYVLFNTYLKRKINPELYEGDTLLGFEYTPEGVFVITGDDRRISLKVLE